MRKPLANALDIDLRGGLTDAVTPHGGTSLLIDLCRRSQTLAATEKHLPTKRSPKGLSQGQMVESVVVLSALGGDCLDDFDGLRRDRGLAALLGYDLPAAVTARQWLDRFHDAHLPADRPRQGSFIPTESAALAGLRSAGRRAARGPRLRQRGASRADGHAGCGCPPGGVQQADGAADLQRVPWVSAPAGVLGGDGAGGVSTRS